MRYIAFFMLVCLFFTVRSLEVDDVGDITCTFEKAKDCKNSKETAGNMKCCWLEGKLKMGGEKEKHCYSIYMKEFKKIHDTYKALYDDLSIDCSGKYLYVASLLLLLFVF